MELNLLAVSSLHLHTDTQIYQAFRNIKNLFKFDVQRSQSLHKEL